MGIVKSTRDILSLFVDPSQIDNWLKRRSDTSIENMTGGRSNSLINQSILDEVSSSGDGKSVGVNPKLIDYLNNQVRTKPGFTVHNHPYKNNMSPSTRVDQTDGGDLSFAASLDYPMQRDHFIISPEGSQLTHFKLQYPLSDSYMERERNKVLSRLTESPEVYDPILELRSDNFRKSNNLLGNMININDLENSNAITVSRDSSPLSLLIEEDLDLDIAKDVEREIFKRYYDKYKNRSVAPAGALTGLSLQGEE